MNKPPLYPERELRESKDLFPLAKDPSASLGISVKYQKRLRAEKRFRLYGKLALSFAVACLLILLSTIGFQGARGFMHTTLQLEVVMDEKLLALDAGETAEDASPTRYNLLWQDALKKQFPEITDESEQRELLKLVANNAGLVLKKAVNENPNMMGTTQHFTLPATEQDNSFRAAAQEKNLLSRSFNTGFLTRGDSRSPEGAGFLGAMAGSFFTMLVCLLAAFPLGVMSAVYLEEFAKNSRFTNIIEVNVNNLAAVPSIVYGLLGLSVYINVMHMPRSASLVGGLTLSLMVFPVIIIATRTALKSIPNSIREAALAIGATPLQVVWHHTLPLAMPGVMTGTILGMARAMGETAPLLMIGMVAFVADIPGSFTQAATTMPVQIFLWAGSPEAGFAEKTAAGIVVLLVLMLAMNAAAIYLRKKFEVRW